MLQEARLTAALEKRHETMVSEDPSRPPEHESRQETAEMPHMVDDAEHGGLGSVSLDRFADAPASAAAS